MKHTVKLTLSGVLECLALEGINSKGIILKAFKGASSKELIGFRNSVNRKIAEIVVEERKDEVVENEN